MKNIDPTKYFSYLFDLQFKVGYKITNLKNQFPLSKMSKINLELFFSVTNTVLRMRGHAKVLLRRKKIVGHPKKTKAIPRFFMWLLFA